MAVMGRQKPESHAIVDQDFDQLKNIFGGSCKVVHSSKMVVFFEKWRCRIFELLVSSNPDWFEIACLFMIHVSFCTIIDDESLSC